MRRLAFLGGKGGVGKTTLATALALRLASAGERTLLVSTDPAHSTGDLLGVALGNRPVPVAGRLDALEIDAEADAAAYVARIAEDARATLSPEIIPAVERHLGLAAGSPGTVESALVDRFADLIARCPRDYDRIVFDTAPTGHTLRLLALPELLTGWVEGLVRVRERGTGVERLARHLAGDDAPREDSIVRRLRERRDRLRKTRARLVGDALFHLVLVPERLPIEETARTAAALAASGITVGAVVVNRVLPADADGAFLRERVAQQAEYLAEIDRRFAGHRLLRIPQAPRDITRREELAALAEQLGGLAPTGPGPP